MLNFPGLLIEYADLTPKNMHCPADRYKPGAVAKYYEDYFGGMLHDHHNRNLSPEMLGIDVVVNYSYLWRRKMYLILDAISVQPSLVSMDGSGRISYKITDVKHPARLITYNCFWNFTTDLWEGDIDELKGYLPHGYFGFQAGFIDGHAEYVPVEKVRDRAPESMNYPPWDVLPNLDWTVGGVYGSDI